MTLLPFEYGVRNLGRSPLRLALGVAGSAVVVLLVIAAAAFVAGMTRSLRASGDEHNIILLGAGSEESVERSEISPSVAGLVAASVQGIRTRLDTPYVSPEVHVALPVRVDPGDEEGEMILMRGVTPAALLVHGEVQIAEGRLPRAGRDEVMAGEMVGAAIGATGRRMAVGERLWIDGRAWTIVGRFVAPGTVMAAELWAPISDVRSATRRESDSCVVLTLDGAEFADIDAFCKRRVDLELVAMRETDHYAGQMAFFRPVRAVAWATAALIGLGGLLGGLNTMFAAFASRIRELGTLRCLGFRRGAIVLSMAQESVLIAAAGSLAGCALGAMLLDGVAVRFSTGVFALVVDAQVAAIGLLAGLGLGLVGALPPAWTALRLPIAESLKAV